MKGKNNDEKSFLGVIYTLMSTYLFEQLINRIKTSSPEVFSFIYC